MTKQQFSSYTPRQNGKRTIEEAISELQREMDVRKRLFDRWVAEGRMSWVEAHDRMERHLSALAWLIQYSNEMDQAAREASAEATTALSSLPAVSLDTAEPIAA